MITLTTGQPGAGKSLFTLFSVKQQADKENRPVFYNGVDLKQEFPNWQHLDKPEDWHTLPAGAIILLDECQRLFRPRGTGAQVPEYVAKLETHRHQGLDLFLITQHPMLVDTNVRRLVGRHYHVQRTFGMARAVVHEFTELRQEPDKSREGSIRHDFSYPKEVFTWYKSAEVHTVKRRIPPRLFFLLMLPLLLGALIWATVSWWQGKMEAKPADGAALVAAPAGGFASRPDAASVLTTAEYLETYTPRIQGLPHTAPAFDNVMQAKSAPQPQACIMSSRKCTCYTSQGTKLQMDEWLCRDFAENGYFDVTKDPYQSDHTRFKPVTSEPVSSVSEPAEAT